jgi:hypothetical protein
MLAAADLLHLLTDEFAGLGRSRFALPLVAPRAFDGRFQRHDHISFKKINAARRDLIRAPERGTIVGGGRACASFPISPR